MTVSFCCIQFWMSIAVSKQRLLRCASSLITCKRQLKYLIDLSRVLKPYPSIRMQSMVQITLTDLVFNMPTATVAGVTITGLGPVEETNRVTVLATLLGPGV